MGILDNIDRPKLVLLLILLFTKSIIIISAFSAAMATPSSFSLKNIDAVASSTILTPASNCITYNPSSRLITISCSSASLSDLYNQVIDKSALTKENPNSSFVNNNNNEAKTWLLNASLKISKGTTFYINSTDTKWLKIISDGTSSPSRALANHIDVFGSFKVDSVKITSWSPATNNYTIVTRNDTTTTRPFIKIEGGATGTTDITNSEIAYLGSKYNPTQGAGTGGLEYFGGDGSLLRGNNIHNNWYGVYMRGVGGIIIENNHSHNNYNYGFDPHTGAHDMIIRNNVANDNGEQGIICSLNCYNITIENNHTYHNSGSGIMFSRNMFNSVARNNVVNDEIQGIFVSKSHNNQIYGNTVSNISNGIYLKNSSYDNIIHDNVIRNPVSSGLYINTKAARNTFYSNSIRSPLGYAIYVQGSDSKNNTFKDNILIINSSSSSRSSLPSLPTYPIKVDDNSTNTQLINNTIVGTNNYNSNSRYN
jgi:mannuronan 5-epimerase